MTASAPADSQRSTFWWCRPTLSRRIAAAMVLSLMAIQGQAFLQIRFFSDPELRLAGTRWLALTSASITRELLALPQRERAAHAEQRSSPSSMLVRWSPVAPLEPDESASPLAARLHATLRAALGEDALAIHINISTVRYRFPIKSIRLVIIPPGLDESAGAKPVNADEPDILMLAGVRVSLRGRDGSWVTVEPVAMSDSAFGSSLPYVPLLVGGLIIALVSTLTARHMMAPLDRLVAAADGVGKGRELVPVPKEGLHEFVAVAQAFEDMQRRLLRFVEDRTQMLAAISHDMRSSLTRLRLELESLPAGEHRAALTREIGDMHAMVDSTLAFASGEARMASRQRTDIAALLISLADEAADTGAQCSYDGPNHAETSGQPVALKRAFRNLIDNAIKYGGTARIQLAAVFGLLRITIDDDGPGIPPERIEEAFAPFRRLDQARTIPGAGLGLTIARDVVLSHGGSIELTSAPGGGLRVRVDLPL